MKSIHHISKITLISFVIYLCTSLCYAQKLPDTKIETSKDSSPDKYKIVFPTSFSVKKFNVLLDKNNEKKHKKNKDYEVMRQTFDTYTTDFNKQLNEVGLDGYKLIGVGDQFIGVVEYQGIKHEYKIIHTTFSDVFSKRWHFSGDVGGDLEKTYSQGYILIDNISSEAYCNTTEGEIDTSRERPLSYDRCEYNDSYLFERKNDDLIPKNYRSAIAIGGAFKKPWDIPLNQSINEYISIGYYPYQFTAYNEVLFHEILPANNIGCEQTMVIRAGDAKKLQINVDEASLIGYKLLLTRQSTTYYDSAEYIAILCKASQASQQNRSYIWYYPDQLALRKRKFGIPYGYDLLYSADDTIASQLNEYSKNGFKLYIIGRDYSGSNNYLVLEKTSEIEQKPSEYKILTFDFVSVENVEKQTIQIKLSPESQENIRQMNNLANKGYKVRAVLDYQQGGHKYKGIVPIDIKKLDFKGKIRVLMELKH